MKKTLNWGLLGTARINRALIPPLNTSKRNKLLAVASRDAKRAETYAKKHKIPRHYGSYEAMLADPEIDVIYNPLPTIFTRNGVFARPKLVNMSSAKNPWP